MILTEWGGQSVNHPNHATNWGFLHPAYACFGHPLQEGKKRIKHKPRSCTRDRGFILNSQLHHPPLRQLVCGRFINSSKRVRMNRNQQLTKSFVFIYKSLNGYIRLSLFVSICVYSLALVFELKIDFISVSFLVINPIWMVQTTKNFVYNYN